MRSRRNTRRGRAKRWRHVGYGVWTLRGLDLEAWIEPPDGRDSWVLVRYEKTGRRYWIFRTFIGTRKRAARALEALARGDRHG